MIAIQVSEQTHVAEARRRSVGLAETVGLDERQRGRLAIAVTEAATNILRHAGTGEILLHEDVEDEGGRVDVIALDRGPGMANVQDCLRDGVSTADGQGTGLGAIQRLSDHCDIYSKPGLGTAVVFGIAASGRRPGRGRRHGFEIFAICLPRAGETVGGDGWAFRPMGRSASSSRGVLFLFCDGLGHGMGAHQAMMEAKDAFATQGGDRPAEILAGLHERLRPTRGAAAALVRVQPENRLLTFAGVGNISGFVRSASGQQRTLSQNGVVGHNLVNVKELSYAWKGDLITIFHSDGLSAKWDLDTYPGLATRQPAMIAAVLYRDFKRVRDDNLVVVAKTLGT
jgi:anti-sigma regulatory factor (Ser/Thr protein kinase)